MTVRNRGQHLQDEVDITGLPAGQVRRRIQNNMCWRTEDDRAYQPSNANLEDDAEHSLGGFAFQYKSKGPVEIFGGALGDPDNTTLMGFRLSEAPAKYMLMRARGVNPVAWERLAGKKAIKWGNLWENTHLFYAARWGKLEKLIKINAAPHPSTFDFDVQVPESVEATIRRDGSILFKKNAHEFLMHAGYAWDASEGNSTGPEHDYGKITCATSITRNEVLGGLRYLRVRLEVGVPADVVYPVFIDPTSTILAADIQDNRLRDNDTTWNYGANILFSSGNGGGTLEAEVFRIDDGSLPPGRAQAFKLFLYRRAQAVQSQPGTVSFFKILAANDWVEGTANGAAQAGSSAYNWAKWATQAWAGSNPCATSGTDYEADATPPDHDFIAYPVGADYLIEIALDPQWVADWVGGAANEGVVMHVLGGPGVGVFFGCRSTDSGVNPPYIEIDYVLTRIPLRMQALEEHQ